MERDWIMDWKLTRSFLYHNNFKRMEFLSGLRKNLKMKRKKELIFLHFQSFVHEHQYQSNSTPYMEIWKSRDTIPWREIGRIYADVKKWAALGEEISLTVSLTMYISDLSLHITAPTFVFKFLFMYEYVCIRRYCI